MVIWLLKRFSPLFTCCLSFWTMKLKVNKQTIQSTTDCIFVILLLQANNFLKLFNAFDVKLYLVKIFNTLSEQTCNSVKWCWIYDWVRLNAKRYVRYRGKYQWKTILISKCHLIYPGNMAVTTAWRPFFHFIHNPTKDLCKNNSTEDTCGAISSLDDILVSVFKTLFKEPSWPVEAKLHTVVNLHLQSRRPQSCHVRFHAGHRRRHRGHL